MGHYDQQRDYDNYEQDVRRCQRLIQEVRSGRYGVLIQASSLLGSNTVSVPTGVFQDLLRIVGRLDPDTYTYPYEGY
jgi:hypothetical protein